MKQLKKYGFNGYAVDWNGKLYTYSNGRYKSHKTFVTKQGYIVANLKVDGKYKTIAVHRLVALAYCPKEVGFNEVDHIDGNRSNNRSSNLRWVSHKINMNNQHRKPKSNPKPYSMTAYREYMRKRRLLKDISAT